MPLNFATKAFSYNLARFWTSFWLYNILLSPMRISQLSFCGFISNIILASFAFLFLSLSSFGLSPSKNLEMEHWSTRWLGLFYHQFCTQNWTRFLWYSSARIWSIFKMDTRMDGFVLVMLAAYQNYLVSSEMMTSQVVQCLPTPTSGKYDSWRERGFTPVQNNMAPVFSTFLRDLTLIFSGIAWEFNRGVTWRSELKWDVSVFKMLPGYEQFFSK